MNWTISLLGCISLLLMVFFPTANARGGQIIPCGHQDVLHNFPQRTGVTIIEKYAKRQIPPNSGYFPFWPMCLDVANGVSPFPLGVLYDKMNRIPLLSFKSFDCSKFDCTAFNAIVSGDFNVISIPGGPTVTKEWIKEIPTFFVNNGVVTAMYKMDKGHLLGSRFGAGPGGSKAGGSEATLIMANIVPQDKYTNEHGHWSKLEASAKAIIQQCQGTFYLVSGVADYQDNEYSCENSCWFQYAYLGIVQASLGRQPCCHVKPRATAQLSNGALSFPEKMWMAGCCVHQGQVKRYYGEADNPQTPQSVQRDMADVSPTHPGIQELFKNTVCQ